MSLGRWSARRPNPVFGEDYAALRGVLVQARQEAGLSQAKLAVAIGKSKSHIAMIERGQRRIDALELYRMTRCLGLPSEALFARIAARLDHMQPQPVTAPQPLKGAPT